MTMAYVKVFLLIESGLSENTLPGSGGQVLAQSACDGDGSRLDRVRVVTVASTRSHKEPAVGRNHAYRISHLGHGSRISGPEGGKPIRIAGDRSGSIWRLPERMAPEVGRTNGWMGLQAGERSVLPQGGRRYSRMHNSGVMVFHAKPDA